MQALPEKYRDPAKEVAALLIKEGDDPKEFYCEVDPEEINAEAGKNVLIFHLWHESAFLPERRGMVGDPSIGGKCRDVWYDLEKQKVTATWGWQ